MIEHKLKELMAIVDRVIVSTTARSSPTGKPAEVVKEPARHRGLPGDASMPLLEVKNLACATTRRRS
jgi:energy-coupling factor transporter ATP-binding protein EcfA2